MVMEPTQIPWPEIVKANTDLEERLFNLGVRLDYDEHGDTLLLTIGDGGSSISKQAIEGIYIKIAPDDYKIIGCIVIGFATDLLAKNKIIRKMLPDALAVLKASNGVIEWQGHNAERTRPIFEAAMIR